MGKHIRKPKTASGVAVKEVSQSSLGVRTRAKTLALQRLQSSAADDVTSPPPRHDFLELRSRRLEKPPLLRQNFRNFRKNPVAKQSAGSGDEEKSQGLPIEPPGEGGGCFERQDVGFEIGDDEIEPSCGENNLELDARGRSTRESTPCSLIRPADSITTPGSSTKQRTSNVRAENSVRSMPTARELEEFFAEAERPLQRRFMEKYNFDIVNDMPLPGRYEWVQVTP